MNCKPAKICEATAGSEGYNLIALTIAVTVLNVLLAASLPLWSAAMQRDREEELIFRGLQYAEGIRVFQRRFGRFPVRLQELIEVEPRCVRQLWRDPMMDDGEWGLIFASPGRPQNVPNAQGAPPDATAPPGAPRLPAQRPGSPGRNQTGVEAPEATSDLGGSGESVTVGPIEGVYSRSTEKSFLVFFDQDTYNAWKFRVALVTGAVGIPAQPGGVALAPTLNSRWLGRPLPNGVNPRPGTLPGGRQQGTSLVPSGGLGGPAANPTQRRQLPNTFGGGQPQPSPTPRGNQRR